MKSAFNLKKYCFEITNHCINQNLKIHIRSIFLLICHLLLVGNAVSQSTKGFQWIKHHGGPFTTFPEWVREIQTDQFGNVYVAGEVNTIFAVDSNGIRIPSIKNPGFDSTANYGGKDIWLAKYDPQGNLLWHKYAGSGNHESLDDMVTDQNGNCYVAGYMSDHPNIEAHTFGGVPVDKDNIGAFIAKVNSNGRLLWHKSLGGDTINNIYYDYFGQISDLKLNANSINGIMWGGGNHILGYQLLFNRDSLDNGIHELTFDLNGNYLGYKSFPFPRYNRIPQVFDISKNDNGYFVSGVLGQDTVLVGGDTILEQGVDNACVFKFDTSLNYIGSFYSNNIFDQFLDAKLLGDTLIAAGHFNLSANNTVNFDTLIYTGGTNEHQAVGVFIFDATTNRLLGLYPSKSTASRPSATSGAAYIDNQSFGIGGSFEANLSLSSSVSPLTTVSNCSSCINTDLFFALFDRVGNLITQDAIYSSGGNTDRVYTMHRRDSMLYIGGVIGDTVIVPSVDTFVTNSTNDAFIAAYNLGLLTSVNENRSYIKADNGLLAYPNPTNDAVNILGKALNTEANLYDIKGGLVRTYRLDKKAFNQAIRLEGIEPGIYFLIVNGEGERQTLKLVKQ